MTTPTPPVLATKIAEWLTEKINQRVLQAGDKIPSENQLSEQFSVSRAVVREALSQLKSEGLIASYQGKGVFVCDRSNRQSFRLPNTTLDNEISLAHTIELISVFEGAAARYAALRRTEQDLKQIQRALIGMEYAILNDEVGADEDYAFHQAIVDATHNPYFIQLNEYLEQQARRLIRQARLNTAVHHQSLIQQVQQEHQAIYEAIAASEAEQAEKAAQTHIANAKKRLSSYLGY